MTRRAAILLLPIALNAAQIKKPAKKSKAADGAIRKPQIRLTDALVTLDGAFRNLSQRPLNSVILHIDFLGPNKESLTTWRGPIDSESLAPEAEAEFHLQVKAPLRAVAVRFNAADAEGHDLRLENPGPHTIE